MNSVLPYTTNTEQMQLCERMKLVDPNSGMVTGPCVSLRDPKLVVGGILHNWDDEAARAINAPPPHAVTWDLSWSPSERRWEEHVHTCNTPDAVEDLLPPKWIAYQTHTEVDEALARVCKLCTALVDRFVMLSRDNNASVSAGRWRQHQSLYDRLGAVVELLEASVGEAIPIEKMRDAEFIRQCWVQMPEEERADVVNALGLDDRADELP